MRGAYEGLFVDPLPLEVCFAPFDPPSLQKSFHAVAYCTGGAEQGHTPAYAKQTRHARVVAPGSNGHIPANLDMMLVNSAW
eukprot:2266441-Amphidinium_carterae.1